MKQSHNNIRPLFITHNKEKEAIKSLFVGNVKVVVYTKGSDGANIYLKNGEEYEDKGFKVIVSDTTWAGDAFIGGFLSELVSLEISNENLCERVINDYLLFANASEALTASVKGAIQAAPGKRYVLNFISTQRAKTRVKE